MGFGRETATAHGFRAMARTMAAERLGIAPEVIEAQLAHAVPDILGRACNRTQFVEQRRDLMVKWAGYLDTLCDSAQVLQFTKDRRHEHDPHVSRARRSATHAHGDPNRHCRQRGIGRRRLLGHPGADRVGPFLVAATRSASGPTVGMP